MSGLPLSAGREVAAVPLKIPHMCLRSGSFSVISLRAGAGSGYSLRAPPLVPPAAKEAVSEGAGQLPTTELVFGFSGGNLCRASAGVSPGRRKPGSSPIAVQDYRGEGHRRFAHHVGRLPPRIHSERGERRYHSRAVTNLLRQLSRQLAAIQRFAPGVRHFGSCIACVLLLA